MPQVKFGRKQIGKPTPASLNFWVRVITVICSTAIGWLSTTSDLMGPKSLKLTMGILGLVLALCNGLAPLFGVQVKEEDVPVEDVTAVETTKP
jgi:hypothetical protein